VATLLKHIFWIADIYIWAMGEQSMGRMSEEGYGSNRAVTAYFASLPP
jgi:hypothetical protein